MTAEQPLQIEKLVVGPLLVNCFVVYDRRVAEGVVIDPGDEPELIVKLVSETKLKIKTIICTHGHVDHVGAVEPLKREFGARFLLNKKDEWFLAETARHGAEFGMAGLENPVVDSYINDGDRIPVGGSHLEVHETPGHSPGGVILVAGEDAFVGDLIFSGSIGRTDLPGGDYSIIIDSFETKLLPLPDSTRLHPGHGESTTLAVERQYNPFLQGLSPRLAKDA